MNKHIKFLIVLAISSATFFCSCNNKNNNSEADKNIYDESVVNNTDSDTFDINEKSDEESAVDKEAADKAGQDGNSDENIIVSFKMSKDDIREKQYSSFKDIDFNRPPSIKGSDVFIGWEEQDKISQLDDISFNSGETILFTAETMNVSDIDNAIYNDTVYLGNDDDYAEIPITIGGNACFAILDLEIAFDTELFSFDSFTFADEDAVCNCSDDGKILISFVSTSNVTADVELCRIRLKKIKSEKTETNLKYNVKDITAWNNDFTDYISVAHKVVNSKIVMY